MTDKLTDEELHLIRDNLHPTHRPHYALLCRLLDEHAELKKREDAIIELLKFNGCGCECGHHYDEHDADCSLCLGCEISKVIP